MNLVIIHHHFRPGGVRRVIELAAPALVLHCPERVRAVVLASGETPEAAWLRGFRQRLPGTPVKVVVQPAFGYVSELASESRKLRRQVYRGVMKLLRLPWCRDCLIWAHNLGLGRNPYLASELAFMCRAFGIPLLEHHHDWWFENRWHHFAAMREPGFRKLDALASAIFATSRRVAHVAINQADAAVLQKHFPGLAGWLPNPVERPAPPAPERVEAARSWLKDQIGEDAPVWLMPCRLLRRKNIAEALLLARWLRPEAWLVTTGDVSSVEEQPYADRIAAAAREHGWRLMLGVLRGDETGKPSVPELLCASEATLLTSMQEGFGLTSLEAAAVQRPLIARELPNIKPDLAKFGFQFPQRYREILVAPSLFDWPLERERQARLFAEWKRLMPSAAAKLVGKPALLAAGKEPGPVPFSRLSLTAQLEVLSQPVELSWERCSALNRFLDTWRKRAAAQRLLASPWPPSASRLLGGRAFAQRFYELVPSLLSDAPPRRASKVAQAEFLRRKLRSENLYPLLWSSTT